VLLEANAGFGRVDEVNGVLLVEIIVADVAVMAVVPPMVGDVVGVPCVPAEVGDEDDEVGPVGVGEVTLGSTAKGQ